METERETEVWFADVFSTVLRRRRRALKITQAELAARVGLSRVSIAMFETGRTSPSLRSLRDLSRELGFSIDMLMKNITHF